MDNTVYISLGSNIGDREQAIKDALKFLSEHPKVTLGKISSIYETEPVGYVNQPHFLNITVEVFTSLTATDVLDFTQSIEKELGRKREFRWGPRLIDLDILLYNHENIETERIIVPHPRMVTRAFVMIPLLEIYPDIVKEFDLKDFDIKDCADVEGVKLWKQNIGVDV